MLVFGFESALSPRDYLEVQKQAVALFEAKKIGKAAFLQALHPSWRMKWILADNYKDAGVIALLERAKKLLGDDPTELSWIQKTVSGTLKESYDAMREFEPLPLARLDRNTVVVTRSYHMQQLLWFPAVAVALAAGLWVYCRKMAKIMKQSCAEWH